MNGTGTTPPPPNTCPNCNAAALYAMDDVSPRGGEGPNLLPGLGGWGLFKPRARFTIVICAECGLTHFYANDVARADLRQAPDWRKLD